MKSRVLQTHRNLIIALVAIGLISLVSIGYGWYYILGVSGDANRLNTEAANLTDEASMLSTLKIRLQRVLPQRDLVYEAIPTTKDVSTFLATLDQLSGTHNIKINSETVGDPLTKTKTGSAFSQTVNEQAYYLLPIRLDVSGNYSDVQALVNDIAATRRLASVLDLAVTADYSDNASPNKVKATFTINIYSKK